MNIQVRRGLVVLVLLVMVALLVLLYRDRQAPGIERPPKPPVEIHPEASVMADGISITNKDAFGYTTVNVTINERYNGSFGDIAPGQTSHLAFPSFADSNKQPFNDQTTKIDSLAMDCRVNGEVAAKGWRF